jgi:hypothetical protein
MFPEALFTLPPLCRRLQNVSQLFKIADKDGNGTIDKQELKEALTTLGFTHLGDAAVRHCRLEKAGLGFKV